MSDNQSKREYRTGGMERASYALYFVGQNVFYIFIVQFLMLFYMDYRFIAPAVVGVIFLVARVWDAVNDPMFGIIVDKSRFKKGKFKPWIAVSIFLIPIACILIFAMPEWLSADAKIAYAAATYILFGMLYTVCDVPIFALVTAITDNVQERTLLISLGRLAATIAMVILSILLMPFITALGWLGAAVLFSVIGFVFMLPINIFTKERFVDKNASVPALKNILGSFLGNKYLLLFYIGGIIVSTTSTTGTTINYIAKWLLGGEQYIPLVMLATFVPMIVISVIVPPLSKKIDKFFIYMSGLVFSALFNIISYFAGYANLPVFLALTAMRGMGFGISFVMGFMFAADCVEYGHYKTGKRAEGITFSIQTFSTKMSAAISGAFAMMCLQLVGYDGALAEQSAKTLGGIWWTSMLLPIIGLVLGFAVLSFYKLRDKDVQVMARINQGLISREEGEKLLSRKY